MPLARLLAKQTFRAWLVSRCSVTKFFCFRGQMPAVLHKGSSSAKRHQAVSAATGREGWQTESLPSGYVNHAYWIMQLGSSVLGVCSQHYIHLANTLTLSLLAGTLHEIFHHQQMLLERTFLLCTCTGILIVGVTLAAGGNVRKAAWHQNL